jgi:hypothetical protein
MSRGQQGTQPGSGTNQAHPELDRSQTWFDTRARA